MEYFKRHPDKWISILWISVLIAALVPIFFLSFYAVPTADDYRFAQSTQTVWRDTGGILSALKTALRSTADCWNSGEGAYTYVFLMALLPGILPTGLCFLTVFFTVGTLCGCILILLHAVFPQPMNPPNGGSTYSASQYRWQRFLCASVLVFLCLQTMPSPAGLYRFSDALYVFMEAALILQIAIILFIRRIAGQDSSSPRRLVVVTLLVVISMAMAFFLGGSTIITGFQACVMTVVLMLQPLMQMLHHKEKLCEGYRTCIRKMVTVLPALAVTLSGFAVHILAPGGYLREYGIEVTDLLHAIISSIYWAFTYFLHWMNTFAILSFLLVFPVIWKIASHSGQRFFHPILTAIGSFFLFASMFTPSLYLSGDISSGTCQNIMRPAMYLLVLMNVANASGWLAANREYGLTGKLMKSIEKSYPAWLVFFTAAVIIMFLFPANKNTYFSISAFRAIVFRETAQFFQLHP